MIHTYKDGYIVNINKPEGWTSFDVVRKLRGITRIKKCGHAGTLDPFATGVLLICLGKTTKLFGELTDLPKEYIASLQLGTATNTLDRTGIVTLQKSIPKLKKGKIQQALLPFQGKIKQRIPDHSAAKVKGQRRYKLARQGKKLPPRFKEVEIHELELLDFSPETIEFRVRCGSGTYVRTLAADIAERLNTVGYLQSLTRTSIGKYRLEDALTISGFERQWTEKKAHENIPQHR